MADAGHGQRRIPVDRARHVNAGKPLVIYGATENNARDIALALGSLKPFEGEAIRAKLAAGLV